MREFFIKKNIFFLFFMCICLTANAQVKLSARLDTTLITIGGVAHLNITIQAPEGTEITTPKLRDSSDIELIDEVKTAKVKVNNRMLITQIWTLTALDSGSFTLPALPFGYKLPSGAVDTVYSNPLNINVVPAKLDSLTLLPIAPIIDEPLTWSDALPFFAGALLALLLAYGVYWYYNRKRMIEIDPKTGFKRATPPHIVAFKKLNALQQEKLWQNGKTKEFYNELTYTVREYLEKRYNLPILEQTTDEFLPLLKQTTDIPKDLFDNLRTQLAAADLIKFAKGTATPEQNEAALSFAFLLVEMTKKDEIVADTI